MAVGGSIQQVSIKGRLFSVAADADGNRDLGGFTNEVQSNGDKTARLIKTAKPWMFGGLSLAIDDLRGDQEYLEQIAARNDFVAMTFTFASGLVYSGKGQITGDVKTSTQNATAPLEFSGPGSLAQQ